MSLPPPRSGTRWSGDGPLASPMNTTIEAYMRRGRLSLNEATRVAELLTAGQGFVARFEADGNHAGAAAIRAEVVLLSGELAPSSLNKGNDGAPPGATTERGNR
jgi:hypothetical protein